MQKLFGIFLLLFFTFSCASNMKTANINYNNICIILFKGKRVVAPNGYLYTFLDNGDVEYSLFGKKRGVGKFDYAESETNAYYYEVTPLKKVVHNVKTTSEIPNKKVNMYVSFILDGNNISMTSDYTRAYYNRLNTWNKNNLNLYGFLREGKDITEYPIPNPDEVEFNRPINFGVLR